MKINNFFKHYIISWSDIKELFNRILSTIIRIYSWLVNTILHFKAKRFFSKMLSSTIFQVITVFFLLLLVISITKISYNRIRLHNTEKTNIASVKDAKILELTILNGENTLVSVNDSTKSINTNINAKDSDKMNDIITISAINELKSKGQIDLTMEEYNQLKTADSNRVLQQAVNQSIDKRIAEQKKKNDGVKIITMQINRENTDILKPDTTIEGNFYINNLSFYKLPENLVIKGNMYLNNANAISFSKGTKIDGNIIIVKNSSLKTIYKDDVQLGGTIIL